MGISRPVQKALLVHHHHHHHPPLPSPHLKVVPVLQSFSIVEPIQ
jgi:hypothetical protein